MLSKTHGWISLTGLRIEGAQVGVYPEERHRPRPIFVDVAIWAQTLDAAESEQLTDTLDYDRIAGLLREIGTSRHYNLLETFAERLAAAVLQRFAVERVRLEAHKKLDGGATASVSVERGS